MSMNIVTVIKALDSVVKVAGAVNEVQKKTKDKYGIIHKQEFIKYRGKEGRLVWDYILFNELTFEDSETGEQFSLGLSPSDKKTEEIFNEMVKRYGSESK